MKNLRAIETACLTKEGDRAKIPYQYAIGSGVFNQSEKPLFARFLNSRSRQKSVGTIADAFDRLRIKPDILKIDVDRLNSLLQSDFDLIEGSAQRNQFGRRVLQIGCLDEKIRQNRSGRVSMRTRFNVWGSSGFVR